MKNAYALFALAAMSGIATAGNVTTTWDSGTLEGWSFTPDLTSGDWEVFAAGGNPGGYVSYIDGTDPMSFPNLLFAPNTYLGDYASLGPGAGFSFDAIWEASHAVINAPVIRIYGANGEEAEGIAAGFNSANWDSFFIDFNESSWNVISGNFQDLLSNVVAVAIHGDNGSGLGREAGVDNFTLVVPAPGSVALLAGAGLVGIRRRR